MAEDEVRNKEIVLTSEEVTRRNVQANIDFSEETRNLVRGLEERVLHSENELQSLKSLVEEYKNQVSILQQQFYLKGTTSFNE